VGRVLLFVESALKIIQKLMLKEKI
jgi:hypothetical protein